MSSAASPERWPSGLALVRTTREFDETSIPAALLRAHRVADGVWGRLVVRSGSIGFAFEDDGAAPRHLGAGEHQVIPPGRAHHLVPVGPVRFVVEFHRPSADADAGPGTVLS